ncbi:MAG: hypothetical protein EOO12_08815 [Chitinophagaceae bacterium]|nr:MAG: hypothetical protein EOO12_08815 [Chitinophagaceae bacterium]
MPTFRPMRYGCLLFVLLLASCAPRAHLRGCYQRGDHTMYYEAYCFAADSFRHHSDDINGLNYRYGAGTYTLSGRRLTLRYGLLLPDGAPPPEVTFTAGRDSMVYLDVRVYDPSGLPLPYQTLRAGGRYAQTDTAGRALLSYTKGAPRDTLQVTAVGAEPLYYEVTRAGRYRLQFVSPPPGSRHVLRGELVYYVKHGHRHLLEIATEVPGMKRKAYNYLRYRR